MFTVVILNWVCCVCADIMLQMGFSPEEIQDSLVNQKYNDVMAAYLLLDYRNSEVHSLPFTNVALKYEQRHGIM